MSTQNVQNRIAKLFEAQDYDKIIQIASKKIKVNPENDYYYAVRGRAFRRTKRFKYAAQDFNSAYNLKNSSMIYKMDAVQSIDDYKFELLYKKFHNEPNNHLVHQNLIELLAISSRINIGIPDEQFAKLLLKLVSTGQLPEKLPLWLPHYFPIFDRQFRKINGLNILSKSGQSFEKGKLIQSLANDRLFLCILNTVINRDYSFEIVIRKLRVEILKNFNEYKFFPNFHELTQSIANQMFKNEYIYDETEEERQAISKLSNYIKNRKAEVPIDWDKVELTSLYRNLNDFSNLSGLNFPDYLKKTYLLHIEHARIERVLSKSIIKSCNLTNKISKKVKKQYEENPYPRWEINTQFERKNYSLSEYLKSWTKKEIISRTFDKRFQKVLIAGCGTGKQIFQLVKAVKDIDITAIDLSLASISYAKRVLDALGIHNIKYQQADLLNFTESNEEEGYDYIECCGVLHHLRNPNEGLKALTKQLNDEGLIVIALYSRMARVNINKAREFIRARNISVKSNEFIHFREYLIAEAFSGNKFAQSICGLSSDFYSKSGYRDLLFHEQEHQFNLNEVSYMLQKSGLRFLGICQTPPIAKGLFGIKKIPKTLTDWHEYETSHPETFMGMYHLLAQKI